MIWKTGMLISSFQNNLDTCSRLQYAEGLAFFGGLTFSGKTGQSMQT